MLFRVMDLVDSSEHLGPLLSFQRKVTWQGHSHWVLVETFRGLALPLT